MMNFASTRLRSPISATGAMAVLRRVPQALVIALAAVFSGCIATSEEAESIDVVTEAIENSNALNANALNLNALNANALNLNALNANALNANALSPSAMSALQQPGEVGNLSRQLMKYVVSCALGPAQSFSFVDGRPRLPRRDLSRPARAGDLLGPISVEPRRPAVGLGVPGLTRQLVWRIGDALVEGRSPSAQQREPARVVELPVRGGRLLG